MSSSLLMMDTAANTDKFETDHNIDVDNIINNEQNKSPNDAEATTLSLQAAPITGDVPDPTLTVNVANDGKIDSDDTKLTEHFHEIDNNGNSNYDDDAAAVAATMNADLHDHNATACANVSLATVDTAAVEAAVAATSAIPNTFEDPFFAAVAGNGVGFINHHHVIANHAGNDNEKLSTARMLEQAAAAAVEAAMEVDVDAAASAAALAVTDADAVIAAAQKKEQRRKRYREKVNEAENQGPNSVSSGSTKSTKKMSHEEQLAARRYKDRQRYANMTPDQRHLYNAKRRDQYHRQSENSRQRRRERERVRYHSLPVDAAKERNERRAKLERERYQRLSSDDLEAKNRKRRERAATSRSRKSSGSTTDGSVSDIHNSNSSISSIIKDQPTSPTAKQDFAVENTATLPTETYQPFQHDHAVDNNTTKDDRNNIEEANAEVSVLPDVLPPSMLEHENV